MRICPGCQSENDDEAKFCDQCASDLEQKAEESFCPDCGGKIEKVDEGKGACMQCGAQFIEKEAEASGEPAAELAPGGELSRLIRAKLRAGAPLEYAVDASCAEFLAALPAKAAEPVKAESAACPVCGKENGKNASQCAGCGILFRVTGKLVMCPRCSTAASGDKCSCGAFLTLSKLIEYVEPSVSYVCPRCKQLFSGVATKCSDCGAEVVRAERLKKYASEQAA